ncbi:Y-family DNA polymerase [uncultured Bifidobacterium sp.]|uniref:Y-family DNA polymerase n=1 Tax=uncultured Bifidobacterium sp. TaxID=165187 RepID=UPI002607C6EB|nr:Y-family DNA polymerase [uncultured Bifidobacterium sp.]
MGASQGGGIIVLADADNFYASCETVFDPFLRGRALVVLSNNDGCVVSRSSAAKKLGIANGTPWFQLRGDAESLGLVARSSNYELYASLSARMMSLLAHHIPEQEVYSIDECFLHSHQDVNGTISSVLAMRHEILRGLGIPVSMGIAPTKTLAKIANHWAKRHPELDGVASLMKQKGKSPPAGTCPVDDLLEATPVGDVWGIGHRLVPHLESQGIRTAKDLRDADPLLIRHRYGTIVQRTVLELRGTPCIEAESDASTGRRTGQILCSQMFSHPLTDLDDINEAVTVYAQRAATRLRRQNSLCSQITVFCRGRARSPDSQSSSLRASRTLREPTDSPLAIAAAARDALRGRLIPGHPAYTRAGVMLTGIIGNTAEEVFDGMAPIDERSLLGGALDRISARFGPDHIGLGRSGIRGHDTSINSHPDWAMRRSMLSPRATTHWNEMLVVHA